MGKSDGIALLFLTGKGSYDTLKQDKVVIIIWRKTDFNEVKKTWISTNIGSEPRRSIH